MGRERVCSWFETPTLSFLCFSLCSCLFVFLFFRFSPFPLLLEPDIFNFFDSFLFVHFFIPSLFDRLFSCRFLSTLAFRAGALPARLALVLRASAPPGVCFPRLPLPSAFCSAQAGHWRKRGFGSPPPARFYRPRAAKLIGLNILMFFCTAASVSRRRLFPDIPTRLKVRDWPDSAGFSRAAPSWRSFLQDLSRGPANLTGPAPKRVRFLGGRARRPELLAAYWLAAQLLWLAISVAGKRLVQPAAVVFPVCKTTGDQILADDKRGELGGAARLQNKY